MPQMRASPDACDQPMTADNCFCYGSCAVWSLFTRYDQAAPQLAGAVPAVPAFRCEEWSPVAGDHVCEEEELECTRDEKQRFAVRRP